MIVVCKADYAPVKYFVRLCTYMVQNLSMKPIVHELHTKYKAISHANNIILMLTHNGSSY